MTKSILAAVIVVVVAAVAGAAFLSQPAQTVTRATQEPSATTTTTASAPTVPEWMLVTLKDPRTGQTFRLADFQGKVVVLEIMAIWCPLCVDEANEMQKALNSLSPDVKQKVVFISVDVDPNENENDLARYANDLKRSWPFVFDSTGSFLKAFIRERGTSVRNEIPSTPLYIIDLQGRVSRIGGADIEPASLIVSRVTSAAGSA